MTPTFCHSSRVFEFLLQMYSGSLPVFVKYANLNKQTTNLSKMSIFLLNLMKLLNESQSYAAFRIGMKVKI